MTSIFPHFVLYYTLHLWFRIYKKRFFRVGWCLVCRTCRCHHTPAWLFYFRFSEPTERSTNFCIPFSGPKEGLKNQDWDAIINVMGIICPPGWDRVNWSVKICDMYHGPPGPSGSNTPGFYAHLCYVIPKQAYLWNALLWVHRFFTRFINLQLPTCTILHNKKLHNSSNWKTKIFRFDSF